MRDNVLLFALRFVESRSVGAWTRSGLELRREVVSGLPVFVVIVGYSSVWHRLHSTLIFLFISGKKGQNSEHSLQVFFFFKVETIDLMLL